ncbi:hypothetical protein KUTeg_014678 [Tegillarca granosa]|uniref:Uncharacterized protein n=1 Tax=Tegillarca granosa TaxID=220873 RepID=A0ABQ9ERX2_TEGGR|nr:hypothetical protein KUTeg_014678 [Tegillarca granosa]
MPGLIDLGMHTLDRSIQTLHLFLLCSIETPNFLKFNLYMLAPFCRQSEWENLDNLYSIFLFHFVLLIFIISLFSMPFRKFMFRSLVQKTFDLFEIN